MYPSKYLKKIINRLTMHTHVVFRDDNPPKHVIDYFKNKYDKISIDMRGYMRYTCKEYWIEYPSRYPSDLYIALYVRIYKMDKFIKDHTQWYYEK